MYKLRTMTVSRITRRENVEGEPIEHKIERILENNEAIADGAPEIYTERKDGVIAAYNIRTDRWEIAAEAMDKIAASRDAKRDEKGKAGKESEGGKDDKKETNEPKVIELKKEDNGKTESVQGNNE